MKKAKKLLVSVFSAMGLLLTSCKTTPVTEQYLKDPVFNANTVNVELAKKKEESWTNIFKAKATTVGIGLAEHSFTDKAHKAGFDVYLRYKDRSKNLEAVEGLDFKYQFSEDYKKEDPEIPDKTSDILTDEKTSDETTEEPPHESTTEEESAVSTQAADEEVPVESAPEEKPEESASDSSSQELPDVEPQPETEASKYLADISTDYFPLSYGQNDGLAVAFSFNLQKLINEVSAPTYGKLYDLKVNLQKWSEIPFLGGTSYVIGVSEVDGEKKLSNAIAATTYYDKKETAVYLVPGETISYVSGYSSVLDTMNKVVASYSIYYKNADGSEGSTIVDFEKTIIVDQAEGEVAEGCFNVHGKTNLVIRQTIKDQK